MSRPRYQRYQVDNYERNGLQDGWMKPAGVFPTASTDAKDGWKGSRADGRSLDARYLVFWVHQPARANGDVLRGRFDTLQTASDYITEQALRGIACGGIWDTKKQEWTL